MNTSKVLLAEAVRLRLLATKLEAVAKELTPSPQDYSKMSQGDAVLLALSLGPQSTREIFERLKAGGMPLKKPAYVTTILYRLGSKVARLPSRKIQLAASSSCAEAQ